MRWVAVALACAACSSSSQRVTTASTSIYVRTDTDRTTVVTPTAAVAAQVTSTTTVDVGVEIDAWTGASVDVTTAATPAIREVRQEVDAGATQQVGPVAVRGSYRFSTEPDYVSHGAVLGGTLELADKNTTLGLAVLGSHDVVGRAGDPFFERPVQSVGARFTVAQVLGRRTVADLTIEGTRLDGYQASPYRFVAVGGDGTCASGAPFCVPEVVPETRIRISALGRVRRALDPRWSVGAEYRFYADDWGLRSHGAQADVTRRLGDDAIIAARYRYYTQGEASFYRERYFDLEGNRYLTRDRKLSAFFTQEIGLSYLHRVELCDGERVLVFGGRTSGARIDYLAFVGLDHVYALELTATLGFEL